MMRDGINGGRYIIEKLEGLFRLKRGELKEVRSLYRLFTFFWEEITEEEGIVFTTLFVRIAYCSVSKKQLSKKDIFLCQRFRRLVESGSITEQNVKAVFNLGVVSLRNVIESYYGISSSSQEILSLKAPKQLLQKKYKVKKFIPLLRVTILEVNLKEKKLTFISEEEGSEKQFAYFDIENKNELFNSSIQHLEKYYSLPIIANFVDVELDDKGRFIPSALVLRPDFLVDVTATANLFQSNGIFAPGYLMKKFVPVESNRHLLIGNIANAFLDHLIYEPETEFRELTKYVFALNPLQIALFSDKEVKDLLKDARLHYQNIVEAIQGEFKQHGINRKHAYVEPSFLSNTIGFQGRLDLLHVDEERGQTDIVELKSGSPFRANKNGISESHYRQILLYDMLIRNLKKGSVVPKGFVLYSKLSENKLRFAAITKVHQNEMLKLRNNCLFLEQMLLNSRHDNFDLFEKFDPRKIDDRFRFAKRDAEKLYISYKSCDGLEKTYVHSFIGFIAREYQLAKVGEHGLNKSNGMAGLWLDPEDEKKEEFRMLSMLEVHENQVSEQNPIINFRYSDTSNKLSRFRKGDIVVLYPNTGAGDVAINYQLFKATIIEINENEVCCRLRSQQLNDKMFRDYKFWNLESDFLDSSITKMYNGLYRFMSLSAEKRLLLLGRRAPAEFEYKKLAQADEMTDQQNTVVNNIISAKDYYLLWGPPGTGKTSVIIKHLVDYYYNSTHENILLLAYTNRAVDEICNALEQVPGLSSKYLRIGSRYSSAEKFVPNILSTKLEKIDSRQRLRDLLEGTRIYVSTVSSFIGKWDILKLKKFSLAIIDEASQLLETNLIGLLGEFEKFVLIGDHKQLPAVVVQDERHTKVKDKELLDLSLSDLRNSMFERLYMNAQKNDWGWAYGVLTQQGRMHQDIMQFPSEIFYGGKLEILPNMERLTSSRPTEDRLSNRMIFINSPVDNSLTTKINTFEAQKVVQIYSELLVDKSDMSIGIITPFRAQIAAITNEFEKHEINFDGVTIDTVERYQGGSRDIIIMSFAINDLSVLSMVSNTSSQGIDRKLNVAITRAKEQIIIVGNKEILEANPNYKSLLSRFKEIEL